jgi:glycosyltransferase involved in cell wall biosynthesis
MGARATALEESARTPIAGTPPRVSIGLPVYNGEKWLAESVDSILVQTFSDFELIICDNASTDGTEAICRRYIQQDSRVRYSRNPVNMGGMRNATLSFQLARGEYFRWAAHDDLCEPTLIERLVEVLDRLPEVVVAVSPSISIDSVGQRLPKCIFGKAEGDHLWFRRRDRWLETDDTGVRYPIEGTAATPSRRFREVITTQGPCEGVYGLIRSDVLRRTRVQQPYTSSDVVMLCDLVLRGPFYVIDEALFYKRWHASNVYREMGPGRMAWSRPELAQTGRISLPYWLQLWGYISTVLRADVPLTERVRCGPSLLRWTRMRWRALASDVTFAAVMAVHSRNWRRRCYTKDRWTEAEDPTASSFRFDDPGESEPHTPAPDTLPAA